MLADPAARPLGPRMAGLSVQRGDTTRIVPLAGSSLVGRGPACIVRIDDSAVPTHWLELRWVEGSWRWRIFAAAARTRGVGMLHDEGWRGLPVTTEGRPQRIRLDDVASVALVEGGPPTHFALDLTSSATLEGDALCEIVEVRDDGVLPLDAEGDTARALADGAVVGHGGRTWRLHLAGAPDATRVVRMDLARPGVTVEIDPERLRATFYQGEVDVSVNGEHVRALATYALARREDVFCGGWLSPEAAWEKWRGLGGNPASSVARLGWDRGRCRAHLTRVGVAGVEHLFETRRMQGVPEVRLGVEVE